jgi:four helix bundle protein
MKIKSFEDVLSWQKAQLLYVELYKLLENSRDYSFKDQLLRATLSISNNIAEGFDRHTNKELRQFLVIPRGSAAEVRSMLIVVEHLNVIPEKDRKRLLETTKDISRLLTGFIKSLNTGNSKLSTDK